ncbi:hypothetical protein [Streptomyces sp. NPDC004435]|uniref:hypothetical protein n=1 Tax=Streptomyces sp. NPDC004435 TaxID=3364701 RepID=UPI00367CD8E7
MVKILDPGPGGDLARLLASYDKRLQALERTSQAAYSSIEGGSMDIYDETGELRGSVGVQPDGGVALVAVNTPPPPTPTPPSVEPVLAGLVVGWDGQWDDSYTTPTDFSLVQVHIGPSPDFLPDLSTHVATITAPLGGTVTIAVDGYTPVWVRLMAANTATTTGPASAAVQGTPRQAVEQDLIDGIVTETKLARDAVTETKIALGAVGATALAAGAVLEDKLAKAAVTLDKIAKGAVTMNALGGSLADGVTQRYVDAMADPAAWQVLNQAPGAQFEHLPLADAPTGQSVGRATGYLVVRGTVQIPYDPDVLYRISARARTTSGSASGTDALYVGALGIAADGVTLVSRHGANTYSSAHYVAASNTVQPVGGNWTTYIGYLRGRAAPDGLGTPGVAADPRAPGVVHDAVRFISPILYLNYGSGQSSASGVMELDAVTVEVLKTGVVDSTNLVVGSVTTAALATDAVTAGKIAADAIGAREIQAGAVTAFELAAGSVSAEKLTALAVTADKIAANAVTAEKLTALSVTAEKLAALSVTAEKIAALSVTSDKLAANSVVASKISAGAIEATHVKAGALTADRLALGADGNIIADPGFEGAVTDQRVATAANWSITTGNNSPRAVRVDAISATAATRALTLADLPAVPNQRMWFGVDYLASADWAGSRISIYAEWLGADSAVIGTSVVTTGDGAAVRGTWQRLTGVPAEAAPANTTRVRIRIASVSGTAGGVAFDNVSARVVVSSGAAGARAELSPQGLQLFDDAGDEAVALMTGRPNYLSLSNGGVAVATIDETGNAGFGDLAVAGKLTIGGDPIEQHLTLGARGLVAIDYQASAVSASTTDYGFVELAFEAEGPRMYRVVLDCYADPSVAGGELVLTLRDGGASTPTISSNQIQSAIYPIAGAGYHRVRLETVRSGWSFGVGLRRLLTTFRVQSGPAGQTVRLFGGSNHPGVFYIEDVGPYIPETGQYNTGGGTATPPVQRYVKTYPATWSGSYANRSSYNSYYGNKAMQGYYSSTNGMQSSLIGFSSALATDLTGATINKAEIYLYFDHWYSNAGGKAVIKAHKHTSRPSTFSCDAEAMTVDWGKNVGKWVDITGVFDSTSWRGIALDPNNSSTTYYGRARGYGETYPPQLRVTYTK